MAMYCIYYNVYGVHYIMYCAHYIAYGLHYTVSMIPSYKVVIVVDSIINSDNDHWTFNAIQLAIPV